MTQRSGTARTFNLMVTGSRDWPADEWTKVWDALDAALKRCVHPFVLLHGGAVGVDSMADDWAECQNGEVEICVFKPDYVAHGSAAPHVRNDAMLREADHVMAFWDGQSRGTKSVIDKAIRSEIGYEVYSPEGVYVEVGA